MGLEPTTSAVTGRRSNQLSHWAIVIKSLEDYTFKTSYSQYIFRLTLLTKVIISNPLRSFSMNLLRKSLYKLRISSVSKLTSLLLNPYNHFLRFWSSPRPISDSQLHMLPCFHLCPIYLVVFKGSYSLM